MSGPQRLGLHRLGITADRRVGTTATGNVDNLQYLMQLFQFLRHLFQTGSVTTLPQCRIRSSFARARTCRSPVTTKATQHRVPNYTPTQTHRSTPRSDAAPPLPVLASQPQQPSPTPTPSPTPHGSSAVSITDSPIAALKRTENPNPTTRCTGTTRKTRHFLFPAGTVPVVCPEFHRSLFRLRNQKVDKHVANPGQQEAPAPGTHGGTAEAVSSTHIRARRTIAKERRDVGITTPTHQEAADITLDPHSERDRSLHRVTRRTSYAGSATRTGPPAHNTTHQHYNRFIPPVR